MFSVNRIGDLRIFMGAFMLLCVSCAWHEGERAPVIVIAVEKINYETLSCANQNDLQDGFQTFCNEAIRFTHAYTPSTLSQAAVASTLTGQFPLNHGVWHNGRHYLRPEIETVAEVAVKNGFRTAFFTGGAPVFSRSGIKQGFENFDDNIFIGVDHYYRSSLDSFKAFLEWLDSDVGNHSFFSYIYVADLQFPDGVTVKDSGEIRGKSYESQLYEVSESLGYLVKSLKRKNVWNRSNIFLFGLNGGPGRHREEDIDAINLYKEVVQVPLFIKPAHKPRDKGINWKIDRNVSLVDVGTTLFELLGGVLKNDENPNLQATTLTGVFERPNVNWPEDRNILIESAWPSWRGMTGSRFGLRKEHFSLIYDVEVKFFNNLIDQFETNRISINDAANEQFINPMLNLMEELNISQWRPPKAEDLIYVEVGKELWRDRIDVKERGFERLATKNLIRNNTKTLGWQAKVALEEEAWATLFSLGQRANNPYWQRTALLREKNNNVMGRSGCLKYFVRPKFINRPPDPKECEDELFISLINWRIEKDARKQERKFLKFLSLYRHSLIDEAVAKLNYVNELKWDVNLEEFDRPSLTQMYLTIPPMNFYRQKLAIRLQKLMKARMK